LKEMFDKPLCNCGIIGVYSLQSEFAAINAYYGLHSLQHRGQEAAGIVASKNVNGKNIFNYHKNFGLVSEIFHDQELFQDKLKGHAAIGHNRYSTFGSADSSKNIQPFAVIYRLGNLAVSHNGNITNAKQIREELTNEGALFQSSSDSEVILHLIARSKKETQIEQVTEALSRLVGAFSVIILTDNYLIGARDPNGFRPLCIGKTKDSFFITSETCALDINSAEYIRDVEPGEIVIIDRNTFYNNHITSLYYNKLNIISKCIFEYIYFSRPDSRIFGTSVDKLRRKLGKKLAEHHPVVDKNGDKVIVISVPDSSNTATIGYQNQLEKMGIPSKLEIGLIRNHYIGRTFIAPEQLKREVGVKMKFNIVKGVIENKTIVIIDDSIVRGTTSKLLVNLIKEGKPKEIHIRISSAPIINPCFYGMDFPSKSELLANKFDANIEEIRKFLDVDSIEYLTIDEMKSAMVDHDPESFCTACFDGKYPTEIDFSSKKNYYD
jgi:amidophosphoribosyltransferase